MCRYMLVNHVCACWHVFKHFLMGAWWVLFSLQPPLRLVCQRRLLWLGPVQSVVQGVCRWGSVKRGWVGVLLLKHMNPAPLTIFCLPCSDSPVTENELYHISRLWMHRVWRDSCVDCVIRSLRNSFNVGDKSNYASLDFYQVWLSGSNKQMKTSQWVTACVWL